MRDTVVRLTGAVRRLAGRVAAALEAGPGVRRGVELAAWVILGLQVLMIGGALPVGIMIGLDQLAGSLLFVGLAAVGWLVVTVMGRLLRLAFRPAPWSAFALLVAGIVALFSVNPLGIVPLLPVAITILVLGGVIGAARDGGFSGASILKRVAISLVGLAAAVGLAVVVVSFVGQGSDEHLVAVNPDPVIVETIDADNPGLAGGFEVSTLAYGSGTDRRRREYGADVDLVTSSVDGSALLEGSTKWRMKVREWYWGFDEEHLPLNGRVWYPRGDGPFPLVLVVHGNHTMEEDSTPGYAWLGELLASRGFICVSVDENFLNGSWRGDPDTENDARGWLLLEHLAQWSRWNDDRESPFHGRVDLARIGLVGHSRGGEAVAIAAAFNRMTRYPGDANVELPSGYAIRAVIAIAPSDGQYEPSGRPTPMDDVSYLVLQGGHDSDVSIFMGARQWHRAQLGDGDFKASVWAYRANHGQFNTSWGDNDMPWPLSLIVNRAPLHSGEDQRRIGGVFMSAFLEAVLHDRQVYRRLFRDHRAAADWLPQDIYVTRYEDPSLHIVADFEEDVAPASASLAGVRLAGRGLEVWREEQLSMRKYMSKNNSVAVLGWRVEPAHGEETRDAEAPSFDVALAEGVAGSLGLDEDSLLVFSLADTGDEPPEDVDSEEEETGAEDDEGPDEEPDEENEEEDEKPTALDLTVELIDLDGHRAALPLSAFRGLVPPVESRLTKLPDESFLFGSAWEITLQTFELPLAAFAHASEELDLGRLSQVRLLFDRSPVGMVVLDDVGFVPGGTTSMARQDTRNLLDGEEVSAR